MLKKLSALAVLACAVTVGTAFAVHPTRASDHDDGVSDQKADNVNLTDLYVFMEKSQNATASADSMIFILNCNPGALPQQEYFFNTKARYEIHVGRVGGSADNDKDAKTAPDVTMRFEFGAPGTDSKQPIKYTMIKDGTAQTTIDKDAASNVINTTPWAGSKSPTSHDFTSDGQTLKLFAGLREDPFFFDVTQFFKLRGALASNPRPDPLPTFKPDGEDFTKDKNVLSIVLRVPRPYFQEAGTTKSTTFDTWATVSVKN